MQRFAGCFLLVIAAAFVALAFAGPLISVVQFDSTHNREIGRTDIVGPGLRIFFLLAAAVNAVMGIVVLRARPHE